MYYFVRYPLTFLRDEETPHIPTRSLHPTGLAQIRTSYHLLSKIIGMKLVLQELVGLWCST